MATQSFETSVVIDAPVETVYDYVADFPRHVEWNHQPTQMEALTDGPVRVGSRYRTEEDAPSNLGLGKKLMFTVMMPAIKIMFGTDGRTVAEVTALEENQRVAWQARMPSQRKGDLMRMSWEIELSQNGAGTTVVQRCEVSPPDESPLASMANEDMAASSKEEVATNLRRLKAILEAR